MAATYVSPAIFGHSNNTSTSTVVTAGFVTSGSNRALMVFIGITNATSRTVSGITRGSDTFEQLGALTTAQCQSRAWKSTSQPQEASAALTVTCSTSHAWWTVGVHRASDVDQTTFVNGYTENSDIAGAAVDPISVPTTTGDLVCDGLAVRNDWSAVSPAGSQTDRGWVTGGGTPSSTYHGLRMSSLPGSGTSVNMGWGNGGSGHSFAHSAANFIQAVTNAGPTVSDPGTINTGLGYSEPIGTKVTVGDVDGNLKYLRYRCGEANANISVTLSGAASVDTGTNNTHDFTITGTQTDLLATHASAVYVSTALGTDSGVIITATDDEAEEDEVTFSINTVYLHIEASNQTDLQATLDTLEGISDTVGVATVSITGIDSNALTDTKQTTVTILAEVGGAGGSRTIKYVRALRRRRRTSS